MLFCWTINTRVKIFIQKLCLIWQWKFKTSANQWMLANSHKMNHIARLFLLWSKLYFGPTVEVSERATSNSVKRQHWCSGLVLFWLVFFRLIMVFKPYTDQSLTFTSREWVSRINYPSPESYPWNPSSVKNRLILAVIEEKQKTTSFKKKNFNHNSFIVTIDPKCHIFSSVFNSSLDRTLIKVL